MYMKKKVFAGFIIATLIIMSMVVFITSCGSHIHKYGDWEITLQPTCTENGLEQKTCECGEFITRTILATGHNYSRWTVVKEATCAEEGLKERYCECGKTETKVLITAGHSYVEWVTIKEPTCTEKGLMESTCECGATTTREIKPKGHTFSEWVTLEESTCTEHGRQQRSCECGTIMTREIEELAHDFVSLQCTKCGIYSVQINEIGVSYLAEDRLTVTLDEFTVTEYEGYYEYTIVYTLTNNNPDTKISEGNFMLMFDEKGQGETQTGFFGSLFYKESITRVFRWKILKTQPVLLLQYCGNNHIYTLDPDSLHWLAPELSAE